MNNVTTNDQLKLLPLFHYIVGAIHILFSSFGLIHFFVGIAMITGSFEMSSEPPPPDWFGLLFAIAGASVIVLGSTLGILTIISGRYIAKRIKRTFSIVISAINCTVMPLGTVLGIITLILLMNEENKRSYDIEK